MNYSDLKRKDVINICDGKKLGKPIDLLLNDHACVEAIVIPAPSGISALFSKDREGLVVPWERVKRIGDDVILVELEPA